MLEVPAVVLWLGRLSLIGSFVLILHTRLQSLLYFDFFCGALPTWRQICCELVHYFDICADHSRLTTHT